MTMYGRIILALLALFSLQTQAQLLKGSIQGTDVKEVTVVYSADGNIMENEYLTIPVTNGTFTFDKDIANDYADVEVVVDNKTLGAHLVKGKTQEMTITSVNGKLTATFQGDGADVSRFYSRYAEAYDIMRYFSLDPEDTRTTKDYLQLLDSEHAAAASMLKGIKNKEQRRFYTLLNEAKYKQQKSRIISDRIYTEGKKVTEDPEYMALLEGVDINDEISRLSGLSVTKLLSMMNSEASFKGDMAPYCLEIMKLSKQYVTNPKLLREMVNTVGYNYFTFGDGSGDNQTFWKEYLQFAGEDNADIPQRYVAKMESFEKLKSGVAAPDITLTDKDGQTISLSEFAKGKFTYIDVWATWCGPCKKEIPYMEKMVERFKGNDKVRFVSISIDENVKAWKNMIENDKPQWPQYNINGDTAKKFSADWGITGIPRFIMIDRNGNIFSADATRPSEESTAQIIEEQTK